MFKERRKFFLLKHDNNDSNSILSNRVMDIKEAPGGEILLATTKGLSIVDAAGKKVRNIFSAKNLVNNFIYGVLGDENGKFWMSTNFGLSVFDASQFKSYTDIRWNCDQRIQLRWLFVLQTESCCLVVWVGS